MRSHFSVSLILFAGICVVCILIYLLRFMQVLRLRESILQSKRISYEFTATSFSYQKNNGNFIENSGLKIKLPLDFNVRPGDTLEVIGSPDLSVQSPFSAYVSLTSRTISKKTNPKGFGLSSLYRFLTILEEAPRVLSSKLNRFLERSQAALLGGMVFGGVENLPKSTLEDMKNTGLVHITSASGFNVSVVIGFSLSLFTRLVNRRTAAVLCLITVFAYSVMAGFTPPIARAALMGSLYLFSFLLGKEYSVMRSLLLAVIIMLIYQPFLIFSISFLLTVASTLGVILRSSIFAPVGKRPGIMGALTGVLEENLKITLSVLLLSTPILLRFFGTFSLVAPLSNSLLLWMVAPLTLVGIGFMAISLIFPGLSHLLAVPLSVSLEVFMRCVNLFSHFPLASIELSSPSNWGILAWYMCLVGFLTLKWHSSGISASNTALEKGSKDREKI